MKMKFYLFVIYLLMEQLVMAAQAQNLSEATTIRVTYDKFYLTNFQSGTRYYLNERKPHSETFDSIEFPYSSVMPGKARLISSVKAENVTAFLYATSLCFVKKLSNETIVVSKHVGKKERFGVIKTQLLTTVGEDSFKIVQYFGTAKILERNFPSEW